MGIENQRDVCWARGWTEDWSAVEGAFLGGPLALGPVCAGRALALATHPASTSDPHYGLLIDEAVGAGIEDLCVLFCV